MSKLVKREVITAKIEGTYGVDAAPVDTDAVLVEDIGWSFAGARMAERNPVKSTLGQFQGIFAGTLMEMSFNAEFKTSGIAGTPPEIDPLLRACGLGVTIVASTSVTYAPVSTGIESITIYYYEDGTLYKLTGCRGTFTGALKTGEVCKGSFTFTGHISTPTDTPIVVPVYDSGAPKAMIAVPFTVGGFSAIIDSLSFDLANEVATPPSISASDGYSEIIITDRNVSGSFDPEQTSIAVQPFVADWKAGTVKAISTGAIGSVPGNIWQLDFPTTYYREISPGDRAKIRTLTIGFGASGDDSALSLSFT